MARLFDDGAVDHLENDTAAVAAAPFSFGGWFYTDDVTIPQVILFVGDKDVANRFYALDMAGDVAGDPVRLVRLAAEGLELLATTTGVTVNTWHHALAVVAAANNVTVYLDGGSSASSGVAYTPAGWDRTAAGRAGDSTPGNNFSGRLAELFFANVAYTADEAVALAGGVPPPWVRSGSVINYWPVFGTGSPEPDYRGTINLTVNGTAVADHAPVAPQFGFGLGIPFVAAAAAGAIMNQLQGSNLGADLYNGTLIL